MKIYVFGNCQAPAVARIVARATGLPVERVGGGLRKKFQPDEDHVIFAQPPRKNWARWNVIYYPRIMMQGFHPDVLWGEGGGIKSPLRSQNSGIIMKAWHEGLSTKSTFSLFNKKVFERLRYFDVYEIARTELFAEGEAAGMSLEEPFQKWLELGCFMHLPNHPKGRVLNDIARALLSKTDIPWKPIEENIDPLASGPGWPLYPELAERFGLEGNYEFRMHADDGGKTLDLKEFIEQSFDLYATQSVGRKPVSPRLNTSRYQNLGSMLVPTERGNHPYSGLPEHQFWRKSVFDDVDPVTSSFLIQRHERIATAGSCFAQHISRALKVEGFNYFVAENDPGSRGSNYGVFSARYGNIYTARQLVQLIDRAYGRYRPQDVSWRRGDRFVDPFRPEIEPLGFETEQDLLASREIHFEAVRNMFEKLDIFVFTLGLTEAWRARADGAVFPLAPGVSGGLYDPAAHEFVNFGVTDVVQDLRGFLDRLFSINGRARVILTVSPVPLAATYEPRHVLVSTVYSKSVLRVAAEEVARDTKAVTYFPSSEIVTGSFNRGRYFAEDLRAVTPEGVDHVMRVFLGHFTPDPELEASVRNSFDIVCEEEKLASLR